MGDVELSFFFHTKLEANDFSLRLSNLSDGLYETGFNLEKALVDNLGIDKKDRFMVLLRNSHVNVNSVSALKDFLERLQEQIGKLPVLSITLAFEPNEETLKLLDEWFSLNLKKQFIFDIEVAPDIIGGAMINFNGKYLDCTLREKFAKIVKDALATEAASKPSPVAKRQVPAA